MTRSTTDEAAAPQLPSPKERRRLREAKSLSEEQVAAAVGVTRATVRSWETGRTSPRGRKRALYAKLIAPEPEALATTAPAAAMTGPTPVPTAPEAVPGSAAEAAAEPTPVPSAEPTSEPAPEPAPEAFPEAAPEVKAMMVVPEAATDADRNTGTDTEAEAVGERRLSPAEAFDELYARTAPGLVRQAYLLTGRRALARESVERAFQLAWHRWPEVAVDRDPAGWVRAAAYEYAMSPWHRLRRAHRHPDAPPTEPGKRALFDALLDLPPAYRRTLLLYDGVGLDLPETAAETEASTPAAAGRLMTARAAVAERLPELASAATPAEQSALLHDRLGGLARAEHVPVPQPARAVRTGSEDRARLWTRAAVAGVALLIAVTGLTLHTAPTHYEPPISPAERVGGVPPRGGPQKLTAQDLKLQKTLREQLAHGPERLIPQLR
ncbi:DNA-directed RNA polymerase specialized sigma24 family protein/DNA-binding transcriptional regulator YiaG [Streptomyces sp. HB372]|uniref:helix-turn-helix domain-containing protein n=1 Tax=Streptomyces sp. or3 TaxID=1828020 RepID=UPI000BFCB9CB|nr:helix-turn-helix domain-containing protein [Streptomyces sp. or3]MDF9806103.1 DNA-directed RNA polymerase specialized sigma24 family protein/DNA-binding transcriptional regulator YiaG [Streptomyces sp. HB372]